MAKCRILELDDANPHTTEGFNVSEGLFMYSLFHSQQGLVWDCLGLLLTVAVLTAVIGLKALPRTFSYHSVNSPVCVPRTKQVNISLK